MTETHVIKDWKQSYDPALKVARGDQLLAIKESNATWIGWVWCTDTSGLSGWLPVQVFEALEIGCVFRGHPAGDSDNIRPPIPI